MNSLHYMGLLQAFPKRYKQILVDNKKVVCNDNIDRIMQQKEKVVKSIYEKKFRKEQTVSWESLSKN